MKLYRCKRNYFCGYFEQYTYCVGQICMFKDDDKFPYFEEYFEEIDLHAWVEST